MPYRPHNYLWLSVAFDVVFHPEVFTIEDTVGEVRYPIAKDKYAALVSQHQVKFYMAMSEHEEVHIGVRL